MSNCRRAEGNVEGESAATMNWMSGLLGVSSGLVDAGLAG